MKTRRVYLRVSCNKVEKNKNKAREPKKQRVRDLATEDLWQRHKDGCAEALDEIIERHMPYARSIAQKYFRDKIPRCDSESSLASCDDLVQSAYFGLIQAAQSYTVNDVTAFKTFAYYRINGAIVDCLRKLQDYPRSIARLRREYKPKVSMLSAQLGKIPTVDEVREHLGEEAAEIIADPLFGTCVFNQATERSEDDIDSVVNCVDRKEDYRGKKTKTSLQKFEFQDKVLSAIDNEMVREVIDYYYFWQMVYRSIAMIQDCSIATVTNRHDRGISVLRKKFTVEDLREMIR